MPLERVALFRFRKLSGEPSSSEASLELVELVTTVSTDPSVSESESLEELSCLLLLSLLLLVPVPLDLVALFCFRESSGEPYSPASLSELGI